MSKDVRVVCLRALNRAAWVGAVLVMAAALVPSLAGHANATFSHAPYKAAASRDAPWAKPGWVLTFHDEFNGSSLDTSKWIDSYPHGARTHNNGEQEYYSPTGYSVSGGQLHLTATRQPQGGMPYSSGMIASYSHFSQLYGWFEIRTKVPAGKGMWPAFWLLPANDTWPPEIDVLEILGNEPDKVYMTNHWGSWNDHHQHGVGWTGPDFSQGFHTFAIDWEPGLIVWYVDGIERARSTQGVPDIPMYVIANLAVGGDWPGDPDATTPFPASMDIDYIRVYKRAD